MINLGWLSASRAYLDESLLHNESALFSSKSILQPVTEEQLHGHGLAKFVGSGATSGCVHTSQFVQHPGLGGRKALKMLLRATSHDWLSKMGNKK